MNSSLASLARRLLIQTHRWTGIVSGLAAVVWFASGITMIYVGGMPQLTAAARLDHLPALELSLVRLTPLQAAARLEADTGAEPGVPRLQMFQERPVYRFPGDRAVFADDGSLQPALDDVAAAEVARRFIGAGAPAPQLVKRLQSPDQWTLSLRRGPLLKFEAGDRQGTQLYVSPAAAEVVQMTTRADRAKAWVATIPHWLYFGALRQNQPLWYRIVVGLSALVCLLAVLGLALAFTQWRRTRPLDLRRAIPYRGGMRWHYITGAVFGVFALTWGFSGLLSMEPFGWTRVPELRIDQDALGGEPELSQYDGVDGMSLAALAAPQSLKEVGFIRIHGEHYLVLRTAARRGEEGEMLVHAATLERRDAPFGDDDLLARLRTALPDGVPVAGHELLRDYDDYYYSRRRDAPLPVLRVKLGDPLKTWLYVDPRNSRVVANVHRYSRVERWLYNGLHSLDFRFWYSKRPLWDVVMITLLLGGLAASSIGLYYGARRLVR